jgi:hypothetical protein
MFGQSARQCMTHLWNAGQQVWSASASALQYMTGYGAAENGRSPSAQLAATVNDQRRAAGETAPSAGPRSILRPPGGSSVHAGKRRVLVFAETRHVKEGNPYPKPLWDFNNALIDANDATRGKPSQAKLLASQEALEISMTNLVDGMEDSKRSCSFARSIQRHMETLSTLAVNGDSKAYQEQLAAFRRACQPRLVRASKAWASNQSCEVVEAVPTDDWESGLIRTIDRAYESTLTTKPDLDAQLSQLLRDVDEFVSRTKPSDSDMDELNSPLQDLFLAAQDRDIFAYAEGLQSLRALVAGGPKPIEASCDRLSESLKQAARSAPATGDGINAHWNGVRKSVRRGIKEIGFDGPAQKHIEHSIENILLAVSCGDCEAYRKGLRSLSRRVKTLPAAIGKLTVPTA